MINVDIYGIIGQIVERGNTEGGDSLNWQGHRIYLTDDFWMSTEEYDEFFGKSWGPFRGYVRHPKSESKYSSKSTGYYKNPWNGTVSRDQLTGVLAALIKDTNYIMALRLLMHHACWLFLFSYNTVRNGNDLSWKWPDFTGPDIWAMELRMFGKFSWVFWPVLNVLDLHNFVTTIYLNHFNKDNDVISYAIKLIACKEHVPTLVSILSYKLADKELLMENIMDYWCGWRKNCGMVDFYYKKLEES